MKSGRMGNMFFSMNVDSRSMSKYAGLKHACFVQQRNCWHQPAGQAQLEGAFTEPCPNETSAKPCPDQTSTKLSARSFRASPNQASITISLRCTAGMKWDVEGVKIGKRRKHCFCSRKDFVRAIASAGGNQPFVLRTSSILSDSWNTVCGWGVGVGGHHPHSISAS